MINILKQLIGKNAPQTSAAVQLQAASKPQIESNKQKKANSSSDTTPSDETSEQRSSLRKAKLIMVTAQNNNKYYELEENNDGTFTASYGRVGSKPATRQYPIHLWDKKIREKINKGYKDTTYLFADKAAQADFLDIKDTAVKRLIDELMRCARQSVKANYYVTSEEVTLQQVREAQDILDQLSDAVRLKMNVVKFNKLLVELYTIIPRRMSSVQAHLIEKPKNSKDLKNLENKLAEEQATLDVMRGQVEVHEDQTNEEQAQTLLDAMGLQVELLEDQDLIDNIKKMMGKKAGHFHQAYKVINLKTQQQFDTFLDKHNNKQTQLFWHGSRNENWLSIMKSGLVLRPANAVINGKMFGYGLYFADKCAKSLNYSSLRGSYWSGGNQSKGFLALYDVHVGKQLKIKKHAPWCPGLTEDNLKKRGTDYDSVYAIGGVDLINNEYIVYNQNQCTIRYFVEVK